MEVGLALSGGAVRGMAHIGVLKYLEERGVSADFTAGTSAGSLMGAMYAAGFSAEQIERIALEIDWKDIVKSITGVRFPRKGIALEINWKDIVKSITGVRFPSKGLVNTEFLGGIMKEYLGQAKIERLEKPFIAVSVDITGSQVVHLDKGELTSALMASCAIPGIFTPVDRDGLILVDGGVLQNLPTRPLVDRGIKTVIAVDLNAHSDRSGPPQNIFDIIFRSISMMAREKDEQDGKLAAYWLKPDLSKIGPWEFDKTEELIELGYREAKNVLENATLKSSRWSKIFRR